MTTSAIAFKRLSELTPYQRWFVECSYDHTIPDNFTVPPDDPEFYKGKDRKIVTSFVYPPIPIRTMDWCAYRDGTEEDGRYGYGSTEQEAVDNLIDLEDE